MERERAAAARLAAELERARDAARRMDVDGMGLQLTQARRAADDLARAGGQRMRSAESLARNLAVAPDTSLDHLCLLAGPSAGSTCRGRRSPAVTTEKIGKAPVTGT